MCHKEAPVTVCPLHSQSAGPCMLDVRNCKKAESSPTTTQTGQYNVSVRRSADFPWLRPFREADPVDPWALYRSWSAFQFPPNKFVEDHLQGGA